MNRVYWMKKIDADGTRRGFRYPKRGWAVCPDWRPTEECGNGLHVFVNGEGDGNLCEGEVFVWGWAYAEEGVDLDGKWKFPRLYVVGQGTAVEMTAYLRSHGCTGAFIYGVVTAGDGGTATAGYRGTAQAGGWGNATAGYRGTATAGLWGTATAGIGGTATAGDGGTATAGNYGTAQASDYGTAQAGDWGTAQAGDYGTATAGYLGTATAGDCGTATAGDGGTATAGNGGTATAGNRGTASAGDGGAILFRFWRDGEYRAISGTIGKNGLRANTPYTIDGMKIVVRGKR